MGSPQNEFARFFTLGPTISSHSMTLGPSIFSHSLTLEPTIFSHSMTLGPTIFSHSMTQGPTIFSHSLTPDLMNPLAPIDSITLKKTLTIGSRTPMPEAQKYKLERGRL